MKLTSKEFKNLFREKSHADHALTSLKAYIKKFNFEYSQLPECKEKNIILKIIKQVDNRTFDRSGLHKLSKWEDGWSENYRAFVNSRYDTKKLKPQTNQQPHNRNKHSNKNRNEQRNEQMTRASLPTPQAERHKNKQTNEQTYQQHEHQQQHHHHHQQRQQKKGRRQDRCLSIKLAG